jgi:hypothetical protein
MTYRGGKKGNWKKWPGTSEKITVKSVLRAKHKAYLYDYRRHITSKGMITEERFNFTCVPLLHLK